MTGHKSIWWVQNEPVNSLLDIRSEVAVGTSLSNKKGGNYQR